MLTKLLVDFWQQTQNTEYVNALHARNDKNPGFLTKSAFFDEQKYGIFGSKILWKHRLTVSDAEHHRTTVSH